MSLPLLTNIQHLSRQRVLLRIDCNMPMAGKKIVDDTRLRELLPTLRWLERKHARIILAGHLGRPPGKVVPQLSLKPIGFALGKLLRHKIIVMSLAAGPYAIRQKLKNHIVMLENLRFNPGEANNDPAFAKYLAQLADLYINEAFSVCHRTASSIVGITKLLPSYAGFNLVQEVAALAAVKKYGLKPVIALIGGAKVQDKLPVIQKLLPRVKAVLTGGAVANTFLLAKGYKLGASLVDKKVLSQAKKLLRHSGGKIILPVDVIVAKIGRKAKPYEWIPVKKLTGQDKIIDLGTATTRIYAAFIKESKTIFWSGPLGVVEEAAGQHASLALGRLVAARAKRRAFVLIGGGETAAFFHQNEFRVDHVSTAGGAMLEFLAGVELPGLKALGYKQ
ncbi:MAG: phosphoglycerate kinase [Patescibacteria group bacterium]